MKKLSGKSNENEGSFKSAQPNLLVYIEPYRLWTIKILKRFNILSKEECANLLESYLETLNKIKANISKESERQSDDYLTKLEPTKWKDQDHYLVLGLQELRWRATEDDIKRAHRRKALKHHPDKRGKKATDLESDYYSCITRAMDILGDPMKRRSFDSVDPTFDDTIPASIKANKIEKDPKVFYDTFAPVFERNARWSVKQNVPYLGGPKSSREHVESFYAYWYNLQSWREFSYLDEEDKEKGENRDERRWLDRQNKAARLQRKKAENQRIRQLVDNAYSCDPRIAHFKQQDKQKKLDGKKARQEEVKKRLEQEQAENIRIEEEEKQKRLAEEEGEKRKRAEEKKQRDQTKKESKKLIKAIEEVFRQHEYFAVNPKDKIRHIEELDKMTKMLSLNEIKEFKDEIDKCDAVAEKQNIFLKRLDQINRVIEEERKQSMMKRNSTSDNNASNKYKVPQWTESEIKLLVKSVSMFPAGTKDRWEVIAQYMAQHSDQKRDAKQVLNKVKQIQEQLAKKRG